MEKIWRKQGVNKEKIRRRQKDVHLLTNAKIFILSCMKKCFHHWLTAYYCKKQTVLLNSIKYYLVIGDIFCIHFSSRYCLRIEINS